MSEITRYDSPYKPYAVLIERKWTADSSLMVEPTEGKIGTKRSANLRDYSVSNMLVRFRPIHYVKLKPYPLRRNDRNSRHRADCL